MTYARTRAKRGPGPAPFHESLKRVVDELGMSQSAVADALGVTMDTVESWLADPSKPWAATPHRLMQIGAMNLLMARRSHLRRGQKQYTWVVTTPDGQTHQTSELSEWLRIHRPELDPAYIAGRLGRAGAPLIEGLRAQKAVFSAKQDSST